MNESKIVDMEFRNNGIYVNVTSNNDTVIAPRGQKVASELRPSITPIGTYV